MKARALLLALALMLLPAVTFAQSKYSDIAAGMQHALVLKADGTLWAFGLNENGQLGDGTTVSRDKPVKVLDNVRQISAGDCSSYAVRNDGSL
jgi:alpha-tubulin suppressor-like RCC1 family protein